MGETRRAKKERRKLQRKLKWSEMTKKLLSSVLSKDAKKKKTKKRIKDIKGKRKHENRLLKTNNSEATKSAIMRDTCNSSSNAKKTKPENENCKEISKKLKKIAS